ncbi:MAG TPA: dCTP deaminase [Candidatus Elarobacter sp.]
MDTGVQRDAEGGVILSNVDIVAAIDAGDLAIEPLYGRDPTAPPFNTSAVDLRLGTTILVPKADDPISHRLHLSYSADYIGRNADAHEITSDRPFTLRRDRFVLARTAERVSLPIRPGRPAYAARVEGKSSRARLGMLVHFTAPTIHAGFSGCVTLEIINLGAANIDLVPGVFICQLVVERVSGLPVAVANNFSGQASPAG